MSNLVPVYLREVRSYFSTTVAWLVIAVFLVVSGILFLMVLADYSRYSLEVVSSGYRLNVGGLTVAEGILRPLFETLGFLMLLMMPLLTMRSFAEEKRSGTIELVFTYPIRDAELVLAKFFAVLTVYCTMLACTLCYELVVLRFKPVPLGETFSGYLGLLLMGSAFISIGVFVSSLTRSQIVSAFGTFGAILSFWVVGSFAGDSTMPIADIARYLSFFEHFAPFVSGIVDTRDVTYYLSVTAFFLFATLRVLESGRWRS